MEKVIRDGKVAVLHSSGFGSGWYSGNKDYPRCLYDPNIVAMVEAGRHDEIEAYCKTKYGEHFCARGAKGLEISWVPIGTRFVIDGYDGFESIRACEDYEWLIA